MQIDGFKCCAHRLAWLYIHGRWPIKHLDHINRVRSDNRISNIREATSSENQRNKGMMSNNTSGITGVRYDPSRNKYHAQIEILGKSKNLGRFINIEDAITARKEAEVKYFSEFRRKD